MFNDLIKKKQQQSTQTVKDVFESIDEALGLSNLSNLSSTKNINQIKEDNERLKQNNSQYQIDEKGDLTFKPTGGSLSDNYQEETGRSVSTPESDAEMAQETGKGNSKKDTAAVKSFKRSEIPLITEDKVADIGLKLKENVFGQDEVIDVIQDNLVVSSVGLRFNPDKPVGCFLFAGPSGVGKTELAVQLAKFLDVPILVVNMGEHALEQDVTKLIGVSTGYVGYSAGGLLTNFVSENQRCVIVFDELEKAHKSIDKILLSILDKGVCRDNKNREVFFNETIFIATTNLGASIEYETHLTEEQKFEYRMDVIKSHMAPEMINRYDNTFQFKPLPLDIYKNILLKFVKRLSDTTLKNKQFAIEITDKLLDFSAEVSYDRAMGGRPAGRFLPQIVVKPLAYQLLNKETANKIKEAGKVVLDYKDKKIILMVNNEEISRLDNTEALIAEYVKGKFSAKVEEIDSKDIEAANSSPVVDPNISVEDLANSINKLEEKIKTQKTTKKTASKKDNKTIQK